MKKIFYTVFVLLGLASCTQDESLVNNVELSCNLPESSRVSINAEDLKVRWDKNDKFVVFDADNNKAPGFFEVLKVNSIRPKKANFIGNGIPLDFVSNLAIHTKLHTSHLMVR